MKQAILITVCVAAIAMAAFPANAQSVETVPLSEPSYTLKNETDPMAMDSGAAPAPAEKSVNRGEAEIAPKPPGADDQPGTSYDSPMPSATQPPSDFSPTDSTYAPPPAQSMDGERTQHQQQNYPNNPVSGVVRTDESKFENRTFCTFKVSFTSIGTGIDAKTAEKVKTYLDANADKLSYKTSKWGKEGEYDYCIDVPQHNNRAKIYASLKKLLPSKDTRDKRTVLTGKGFNRVENSM